ncbi:MAG: hypothetical protein H3C28_04485 [Sphingomonadales bacterium]|nr:hypothetical protein [Sphingomonadales bacterium]
MTTAGPPAPSDNQGRGPEIARSVDLLLVAYIAYLIGLISGGLGSLVGVVIAYLKRDDEVGTWRESHYIWLIRTFWIGLFYAAIGFLTLIILIGKIILFATVVWFIVRLIKGWVAYGKEMPIDNAESWLVG